ncbi:MAG: hypothetical protein J7M39_10670 [Anaerolineae bacterium]|nr:hypothetical protein [Anaerolineae bacterium]
MTAGRELLLGLDVGTTATKAIAFDLWGQAAAAATQAYELITPRPRWVEQDPEDLWSAVVRTVRDVQAQLDPEDRIIALSQASQGGTTIPVDATGAPTHNAISWMDQRGSEMSERARAEIGADTIRTTTGWPLGNTLPLQHIAWLREHRPAVFAQTDKFLFVNDFITQRLTGKRVMNPSDGTMTQLLDIATAAWDRPLLAFVGITRDQVSELLPSGHAISTLTVEASEVLGLSRDVLVVNGAHDQYCAAVGTGVTQTGEVLLSCGTAWVLLAVPDSLQAGRDSGMALSCHAVPGRWGGIRSLGGIGTSLEWLLSQLWRQDSARAREGNRAHLYATLNEGAARVPPGANGLLFVPLSGGHVGARTSGGFLNLMLSHAREDMARAVMEGITYELRWTIEEIQGTGVAVEQLTMVGGAAQSPIWPQIVADVTGVPVTVPAESQAAALGAAILAGVGAGCFPNAEAGFSAFKGAAGGAASNLAPDSDTHAIYDRQFADYRRIYRTTFVPSR